MDFIEERFELVKGRIEEIVEECGRKDNLPEKTARAFKTIGELWLKNCKLYDLCNGKNGVFQKSLDELKAFYDDLYFNILPENYERSLENPAYAVKVLKRKNGRLLSVLATEVYAHMNNAANGCIEKLTTAMELYVEIYCLYNDSYGDFEKTEAEKKAYAYAKDALYSFKSDNLTATYRSVVEERFDPSKNKLLRVLNSDLKDLRYLYMYGDYITENEFKTAEFLNSLDEKSIYEMAETLASGYIRGFKVMNAHFKENGFASLSYPVGMERMALRTVKALEDRKCGCTMRNAPIRNRYAECGAVTSTNVNSQFFFDHRNDNALWFDRKYAARDAEAFKTSLEQNAEKVSLYNGPINIGGFGLPDFNPVIKREACSYTPAQDKLEVEASNKYVSAYYTYVKQEETSFSVIAYPFPAIGKDFESIFADTVKVNNLDNEEYIKIQQNIIDELDKGYAVHVTGRNGNQTDVTVALTEITKPDEQTVFENCTADVNIPLGEVFTSPRLKGTNGLLHVKKVFLNGLEYRDLKVRFKDGVTEEITCRNYEDESENKRFISENLLFKHDFLPLGEFAIGTNTTAFVMGEKYGIQGKLPILIAEKTGPHFAIGDTCYSHAEDHKVYNPDGKEIISRSNDFADLREKEPEKAYFNCHTDITIPYDELGDIISLRKNGKEFEIIKNGRFVVKGTETLNDILDEKGRKHG
ncbi:MAG: aminopeptidase [Lachnospiraceae bacterium]|nr:aminopeptidase [Lachnospiraceae bacterium]